MQVNGRKLVNIPVKTKSGQALGRLSDIVIDADTGRLSFLQVRVRGFIPGLMDQELRIAWAQVVSLSDKEAIVADAAVEALARNRIAIAPAAPQIQHKTNDT
jgi:sporulation protein YlmC with PRC-barrel domain